MTRADRAQVAGDVTQRDEPFCEGWDVGTALLLGPVVVGILGYDYQLLKELWRLL